MLPNSYAVLCIMCFCLIALTNVPLYFGRDKIGNVLSNDPDVRRWFAKIAWVLVAHTQSRICSINAGALLIAIKKGRQAIFQNVLGFYIVAAPLCGTAALTNWATTDTATKIMWCMGTTAIAQAVIGVVGFIYMGSCVDWVKITAIVAERANSDKLVKLRQRSVGARSQSGRGELPSSP